MLRESLAAALQANGRLEIVGQADDVNGAISRLQELSPDVLVVDLNPTDELVLRALQRLHARPRAPGVVALALPDSPELLIRCENAGVRGCLARESPMEELIEAVHSVARGERFCSPQIAGSLFAQLADAARRRPVFAEPDTLTRRERQILALIRAGQSNRDIAERLGISLSTVKNHVHSILDKLHVGTRLKAVVRTGVNGP